MKKLQNAKWFLLGIVFTLIISTLVIPAIASTGSRDATLFYRDIKITLNGKEIDPKDANGTTVEPFIIDGTTYLPVRAISGALSLDVVWDDPTSTVKLSKLPSAPFTLGMGQYTVGEDIPAGKYDCLAISGSGNFTGKVASLGTMGLNEILGAPGSYFENSSTYLNLLLADGDVIKVSGDLRVEFSAK